MARGTLEERFWKKVDKREPDECWEWMGAQNGAGYGKIGRGGRREGLVLAHRLSWELANGVIPEGQCVCHHCDNPGCVNPAHLFLGTNIDNMQDAVEKGRMVRGSAIKGAKLTEQDVREILCFLAAGYPHKEIAEAYNVARVTITQINTGKIWAWVERPTWVQERASTLLYAES